MTAAARDEAPMDAEEVHRVWLAEQATTSRGSMDVDANGYGPKGAPITVAGGFATHKQTVTLAWRDLWYTVYPAGRDKPSRDILKGLSGAALPHHVMALMGPTGSGKTSLLNVLSGRVPAGGILSGEVTVNGQARSEDFNERVAYVMQEELLFAFLTVHETFMLHARLRLPPSTPDKEKAESVDRLIAELGLKNVRDSPWDRRGLPTRTQRRRTEAVQHRRRDGSRPGRDLPGRAHVGVGLVPGAERDVGAERLGG